MMRRIDKRAIRPIARLAIVSSAIPQWVFALGGPSAEQLERIAEAIRSKTWADAVARCDKAIDAVSADRPGKPERAEVLADLLARCTVASGGAGDADSASWLWHSAQVLDSKTASSVGAEFSPGVAAPALRPTVKPDSPSDSFWGPKLHLPDGPLVEGALPQRISTSEPHLLAMRGRNLFFKVQVVVGTDGRLHEPKLLEASSCPAPHAFVILRTLRRWRFEPARGPDGPVAVIYNQSITVPSH